LSRIGATHEWMPIDRAMVDKWRDILLAHYPALPSPGPSTGRRLFIGRKGTKLRRLKNEDEIAAMLAQYGFETFTPSAGDQRSQIEAFGAADIVVAVHGAALTNLVFCRPGTRVVEIFPSNFIKSPYLWLAAKLDLKYEGFFAGNGDYWQAFDANARDLQALVQKITAETKAEATAGLRPEGGLSKEASLSAAPLARPLGPLEDE
jgi:capsular polysaccharide biosynthesis protein